MSEELTSFLAWLDRLSLDEAEKAVDAVFSNYHERLFASLPPISLDGLNMEVHGNE